MWLVGRMGRYNRQVYFNIPHGSDIALRLLVNFPHKFSFCKRGSNVVLLLGSSCCAVFLKPPGTHDYVGMITHIDSIADT